MYRVRLSLFRRRLAESAEQDHIRVVVASARYYELLAVSGPGVRRYRNSLGLEMSQLHGCASRQRQHVHILRSTSRVVDKAQPLSIRRPAQRMPVAKRRRHLELFYDGPVVQLLHHNPRFCAGPMSLRLSVGDQHAVWRNDWRKSRRADHFEGSYSIGRDFINVPHAITGSSIVVEQPFAVRGANTLLNINSESELFQLTADRIQTPDIRFVVVENPPNYDRVPRAAAPRIEEHTVVLQQAN